MNTTEKNKMIAEFMGLKPVNIAGKFQWNDSPFFYVSHDTEKEVMDSIANYAKYHSDWNWLMPVVEKIERTKMKNGDWVMVSMSNFQTMIMRKSKLGVPYFNDEIITGTEKGKMWSVWMAACEFIEWYNKKEF